MENFLTSYLGLELEFLNFSNNIEYAVYGTFLLTFTVVIAFILSIVYRKVRRKFPSKVNCWFCNNNSTVPYELSNSWDCPHCKQYNGFSKDGDYNKVIPEQFNYKLNENISKILKTSVKSSENITQNNGFCKLCNINQQLKIQQLALFTPMDENHYYEEIEQYRQKLEKAYQLCSKCEKALKQTLENQEYNLLQSRLNSHRFKSLIKNSKRLSSFNGNNILVIIKKRGISGMKIICIILAIVLFLALIIDLESEHQILGFKSALPETDISDPLKVMFEVLLDCKDKIYHLKKELSLAGLFCFFFVFIENQKTKQDSIILSSWGFLYLSCWSTLNSLPVITSGICLFLNIQRTQNKFMYLSKKSVFQPVKKVFPEIYNNNLKNESKPFDKIPSPFNKNENIVSLDECTDLSENDKSKQMKQKLKNLSDSEERKKIFKQRENEVELIQSEVKETVGSKLSPNSSYTQNSFHCSLEEEKSSESNGPFSDVFHHLSSLQLGGKPKKPNKPPNFLFANHNFSEVKSSSSIIKPPKFIRNFNSTSWTESNECNSRSSTPSSGYSSQKPENMEGNRNDFSKIITPTFVNSFGRQSPGFVPFHQYPGPLGQTTIYTCSRPNNFPFFFPPWQGYSTQKLSSSSRISDASDCDNLFQESSRRFERNQKQFKFKTILYYFSIFFNFVTMVSLAYFLSTGVILVDWKLPKFDFFM